MAGGGVGSPQNGESFSTSMAIANLQHHGKARISATFAPE
jgi:hypothetical protein